jgi:hypothetical protein
MHLSFVWTAGALVFVAPATAIATRAAVRILFGRDAPPPTPPDAESGAGLPPNVVDPRWLL